MDAQAIKRILTGVGAKRGARNDTAECAQYDSNPPFELANVALQIRVFICDVRPLPLTTFLILASSVAFVVMDMKEFLRSHRVVSLVAAFGAPFVGFRNGTAELLGNSADCIGKTLLHLAHGVEKFLLPLWVRARSGCA